MAIAEIAASSALGKFGQGTLVSGAAKWSPDHHESSAEGPLACHAGSGSKENFRASWGIFRSAKADRWRTTVACGTSGRALQSLPEAPEAACHPASRLFAHRKHLKTRKIRVRGNL
jgi:hypothetical protein